jgi:hypothetical protein
VVPRCAHCPRSCLASCFPPVCATVRLCRTKAPTALPRSSYALFAVRDSHTIAASFLLPPIAATWMLDNGVFERRNAAWANALAQIASPTIVQLLSTPWHLMALDLYNRPSESWASRYRFIREKYLATTAARIGRILPAFGIGGYMNRVIREECLSHVHAAEATQPQLA